MKTQGHERMNSMKNFIVFGDSLMQGVIFENNRYRLYHSSLSDKLAEKGYKLINKSHMGATVKAALPILEKYEGDGEETVALFEYGGNDCNFDWQSVAEFYDKDKDVFPKIPEKEFAETYKKAIGIAKEKGMSVAVSSLIPIDADKFLTTISKNADGDKILKWLGDISMLSRWQEHYSRIAEDIASSANCRIIDIRTDFLLSHAFRRLICDDGIHPTREGHEIIADRIVSCF